ncbi:MAG: protein translocase subunit SecF [Atopobiaceae bacterium]|nr:protein translocase subunit SecF [Atopobiaceae bacterium]
MRSGFSREIPFMDARKILLGISAVLCVLAIVGILVRGLVFGIEFIGGTEIDFYNTADITIEQMRSALSDAGEQNVTLQTTITEGESGFLARTETIDPAAATDHAAAAAKALNLPEDSFQVTTIGPDWGANVTSASAWAFVVAIGLIIAYCAWRYDIKMAISAVIALLHDLLVIIGVYAWTGTAITPNVVAALLTIMGYSLYDTVVVFHRTKENSEQLHDGIHRTYYQIANYSINEVIMRTINTSVTSLVPVICMLLFGGATLKDFAFAMAVGLVLGAYSSIGVASPIHAIWKTSEDHWSKMEAKYGSASAQPVEA